jgi:hypothetical protein
MGNWSRWRRGSDRMGNRTQFERSMLGSALPLCSWKGLRAEPEPVCRKDHKNSGRHQRNCRMTSADPDPARNFRHQHRSGIGSDRQENHIVLLDRRPNSVERWARV